MNWLIRSCRFLDAREVLGKTTNELNKYITVLNKMNYISVPGFDYSLEVSLKVECNPVDN